MKKSTSKILLAVMSLIIALGLATGTTFAWFTSNRTVSVGNVQATVTTGNQGLYVAVKQYDGTYTPFRSSVLQSDLTEAIYGDGKGLVVLDHLTTADGGKTLTSEDGTTEVYTTYEKGTGTGAGETATNKFVEFTLKFRTTTAQNIYLAENDGTVLTASKIEPGTGTLTAVRAWQDIPAETYTGSEEGALNKLQIAAGDPLSTRAAYATRVSFINNGTGRIWAPFENANPADGDGYTAAKGFYKGNLAYDFRNSILGTTGSSTVLGNQVKLLSDADATANTPGTATVLGTTTGTAVFETEITVRIWIEGSDGDCLNSIFGDQIIVNLVFNCTPAA